MTRLRKAWRRLTSGEGGYSLIELVVTMAVLGIVLGGLTTVFVSGSRAEINMNERFQAQQSVRSALARVRTDLHEACSASASVATVTVGGVNVNVSDLVLTDLDTSLSTATCTVAGAAWCFAASSQYSGRLALYRLSGASSCPLDPTLTGTLVGDAIVTGSTYFTPVTGGSGQHDSVSVNLPANASPPYRGGFVYDLTDQIVLRNSERH